MTTPSRSQPLSPHLQVYKFTLLMASSIINRVTGAGIYLGSLIFMGWLLSAAIGPGAYHSYMEFLSHWLIRTVLFFATWGLFQHALGGIRHLIWDTGLGLDVATARLFAIISYIVAFALTLITFALAYMVQ